MTLVIKFTTVVCVHFYKFLYWVTAISIMDGVFLLVTTLNRGLKMENEKGPCELGPLQGLCVRFGICYFGCIGSPSCRAPCMVDSAPKGVDFLPCEEILIHRP